eukprot:3879672-Pleurochrysis_carterae.AAC.3
MSNANARPGALARRRHYTQGSHPDTHAMHFSTRRHIGSPRIQSGFSRLRSATLRSTHAHTRRSGALSRPLPSVLHVALLRAARVARKLASTRVLNTYHGTCGVLGHKGQAFRQGNIDPNKALPSPF